MKFLRGVFEGHRILRAKYLSFCLIAKIHLNLHKFNLNVQAHYTDSQ